MFSEGFFSLFFTWTDILFVWLFSAMTALWNLHVMGLHGYIIECIHFQAARHRRNCILNSSLRSRPKCNKINVPAIPRAESWQRGSLDPHRLSNKIKLKTVPLFSVHIAPVVTSIFYCIPDQGTGPRVSGLHGSAGFWEEAGPDHHAQEAGHSGGPQEAH